MSTSLPQTFSEDEVVAFLSFLYAKMRATHSSSVQTMLDAWYEYKVYGLNGRPPPEKVEQMFGISREKGWAGGS